MSTIATKRRTPSDPQLPDTRDLTHDSWNSMVNDLRHRVTGYPNLRTRPGPVSPWIFRSTLAGWHLPPKTVMDQLRELAENLLGTRKGRIDELLLEVRSSPFAEALGFTLNSHSSRPKKQHKDGPRRGPVPQITLIVPRR